MPLANKIDMFIYIMGILYLGKNHMFIARLVRLYFEIPSRFFSIQLTSYQVHLFHANHILSEPHVDLSVVFCDMTLHLNEATEQLLARAVRFAATELKQFGEKNGYDLRHSGAAGWDSRKDSSVRHLKNLKKRESRPCPCEMDDAPYCHLVIVYFSLRNHFQVLHEGQGTTMGITNCAAL